MIAFDPFTKMQSFKHHLATLIAILFAGSTAVAAVSDEQLIEDTYNAWVEASNEKDIVKWSSFLADDPYFSPADASPLTTREAILDYYKESFSDPEFSLDCEQLEVHVAQSGEMGWSRGVCNATFTGPDGRKASGSSRWFKVWTRQPDGTWKGRVNSWKFEN